MVVYQNDCSAKNVYRRDLPALRVPGAPCVPGLPHLTIENRQTWHR